MRTRLCDICGNEMYVISPKTWTYKKYKGKWHWACGYNCFSKLEDKLKVNNHFRR